VPTLSVVGRGHSSTMATFREAPLRSRTVGFPESGSDPGLSPLGLPARGVAQALTRIHPSTLAVCPKARLYVAHRRQPGPESGCGTR
jgi:hypothetical protein